MKTNLHRSSIPSLLLAGLTAFHTLHVSAASPSELLEKGIYTEETKGDVDSAITIYQQLVAESKNAQSLTAQALLRLGQCYLKKSRATEAAATFAKRFACWIARQRATDHSEARRRIGAP